MKLKAGMHYPFVWPVLTAHLDGPRDVYGCLFSTHTCGLSRRATRMGSAYWTPVHTGHRDRPLREKHCCAMLFCCTAVRMASASGLYFWQPYVWPIQTAVKNSTRTCGPSRRAVQTGSAYRPLWWNVTLFHCRSDWSNGTRWGPNKDGDRSCRNQLPVGYRRSFTETTGKEDLHPAAKQ